MEIIERATRPLAGQMPGTSGLRKKTSEFSAPGYLENYIQCIFDAIGGASGKTFVLGGDARYFNAQAIDTIIRMALANGAAGLIIGKGGLLSTPAASHAIRSYRADGGIILSASHNPGGPQGDFGVKFNAENGGPAPEPINQAIYDRTQTIQHYRIATDIALDLDRIAVTHIAGARVEIMDPVSSYADLMQGLFDFDLIRDRIQSGFRLTFDAMHAVTGPYASAILEDLLGAPTGTVKNSQPKPDFGGGHPDPNPVHAAALYELMFSSRAPDLGAASDGDGDRNIVLGPSIAVGPSDSLAVLAANLHLAPGYLGGLQGIARSMPTSRAADAVAKRLKIPCFECPTGWKYFCNLLDAGKVTICGEESAGSGSDHVREKDGLWAVLAWLNILAARNIGIADLMADHWAAHGRHYYTRHDYEELDPALADNLYQSLADRLPVLPGTAIGGLNLSAADDFAYADPVNGSLTEHQGLRILFAEGSRAVIRLSGTGTVGATLRLYLERYEPPGGRLDLESQAALADLIAAVHDLAGLAEHIGRSEPDVKT